MLTFHGSLEWFLPRCSGHYTWLSPRFSIVASQLHCFYLKALGHTMGTDSSILQSLLEAPSAQKLSIHIAPGTLLGILDSYSTSQSNPAECHIGINWDTYLQDSDFSSPLSLQVGLVLLSSHLAWIPIPLTSALATCCLISIWQTGNHSLNVTSQCLLKSCHHRHSKSPNAHDWHKSPSAGIFCIALNMPGTFLA